MFGRFGATRSPLNRGSRGAFQLSLLQRLLDHRAIHMGSGLGEESEAQEDQAEDEESNA
jgi:hypothetical protein